MFYVDRLEFYEPAQFSIDSTRTILVDVLPYNID